MKLKDERLYEHLPDFRRNGPAGGMVMRLSILGEMAEWSNAAVSKTVVRLTANRGFESPSLRKAKANPPPSGGWFLFSR